MAICEDEIIWQERYRELERTLEFVIRQAGAALRKTEEDVTVFQIRKIVRTSSAGGEFITCVADGENLEYSFTFTRDAEVVNKISYQRMNCAAIGDSVSQGANECLINVKCNSGRQQGSVMSKRVAI